MSRRGMVMLAGALALIPAVVQAETFALVGGTVHPASGPAMANATVVVRDGKIESVGRAAPAGVNTIDCRGKHVYPGMIAANTSLGLVEIESVRGTVDNAETGNVNPNVRAEVEINPESDTRTGVLVEYDRTDKIFSNPTDDRTENYVTGRFG